MKDGKVLDQNTNDNDFLMRDVVALHNKHFIRNLTTKVIDAMKAKAESGWFPANHVPLGYIHKKMRDENGKEMKRGTTIVRDPDERNVRQVQREFELRAEGFSYEAIRSKIVDEGLISGPRFKTYRANTVEKRINSKFYRGKFDWQGIEYIGNHELLIPKQVLNAIDSKKSVYGRRLKEFSKPRLFEPGWLVCGDPACGCQVTFDPKVKTLSTGEQVEYRYVRCSNSKKIHKSMRGMQVTEKEVLKQFEPAVASMTLTKELAEKIAQAMRDVKEKALAKTRKEMDEYKDALARLETAEDEAYEDHKKGFLDEAAYHRRVKRIREQRVGFTDLMDKARSAIEGAVFETAESLIELATNAKSLWLSMNDQDKVKYLKTICSNQVLDGPTVRYELKKPISNFVISNFHFSRTRAA